MNGWRDEIIVNTTGYELTHGLYAWRVTEAKFAARNLPFGGPADHLELHQAAIHGWVAHTDRCDADTESNRKTRN